MRDRITNKMAVHLYVLDPLIKDEIASTVNSRLVVTVHGSIGPSTLNSSSHNKDFSYIVSQVV